MSPWRCHLGRIGAVADFNSDGRPDFVWQNVDDGQRQIGLFAAIGPPFQYAVLPTVSTANMVVSAARLKYEVAPLNLKLEGHYVVQAVQDLSRSVPLIAGRAALARAFVTANDYNAESPTVRFRVTQSDGSFTDINATRANDPGVPTSISELFLATSYNAPIPGNLIAAGASLSVTVDPAGVVNETDETDNMATTALLVRTPPTFQVRFIPVRLTGGETGNVSPANVPNYMNLTMKLWPFAAYSADVHDVFTSSQSSIDTGAQWLQIISEVQNLRVVEGSSRYYYGVLALTGSPFAGGMGYLGYPTAIGLSINHEFDTTGTSGINAHEWGHNFNRPHTPGCGPDGPDPAYPVSSGHTDAYGYDASTASMYSPALYYDIMSYCGPQWVSGWSFKHVINFVSPFAGNAVADELFVPSLVVWGRIQANGSVVLEPSFEVTTKPSVPADSGPFSLVGRDHAGAVLFSRRFGGHEIPDGGSGERHFSFAIPLSHFPSPSLHRLEVINNSGIATGPRAAQHAQNNVSKMPDPAESMQRVGDAIELTWNARTYKLVVVRQAATGQVIAFARNGKARFAMQGRGDLELIFSDGVRSRLRNASHP